MYRIPEEIATYLSNNKKNPEIPGLQKDTLNPFTPRNKFSIGFIDESVAFNTDALYMIEADSNLNKFFLYKNGELNAPNDTLEIPRVTLDFNATDQEEMFDVSDCSIQLPNTIDKLTEAITVNSLEELFYKEPDLKLCIEEKKDNESGFFKRLIQKISSFRFSK